jgi:hypothetical protein
MSQRAVDITISRLLADDEFRDRFLLYPLETLAGLRLEGIYLTRDEMHVFVQTDLRTWTWNGSFLAAHLH